MSATNQDFILAICDEMKHEDFGNQSHLGGYIETIAVMNILFDYANRIENAYITKMARLAASAKRSKVARSRAYNKSLKEITDYLDAQVAALERKVAEDEKKGAAQ